MSHPNEILSRSIAAFALSLWLGCAYGAEPDVSQLRREVEQLKRSMHEMQTRLQAVEAGLEQVAGGAAAAPAAAEPAPATTPRSAIDTTASNAAATPAKTPPQPANTELVALKRAWAGVQPGVASAQVKDLLGPASQELKINGKLTWYYSYPGIGAGSIFFNDDGRVSSRKSPFLELTW